MTLFRIWLTLFTGLTLAGELETDWFVDRAADWGIDFVHFNGMTGAFYIVEEMGPGCGFLDYDNDGDLDVYLVQGALLGPGKSMADALFPHPLESQPRDRLYRNDLRVHADGTRTVKFTDVTAQSLPAATSYGMGAATGDFNRDGWTDVYLANFGPNQLLRNNGDGTFSDFTEITGTGDPRLSVSASSIDYDRDGWPDLYVANYVRFTYRNHKTCVLPSGRVDYCGPASFPPEADRLYRNRGDGSFEDVSLKAGIHKGLAPGLGVLAADFNRDGLTDLYVANDGKANFLWMNRGNGTFVEDALLAGCALNSHGAAEGSMGVDAADFDGDGDEDLFMTHLTGESHTLYVNEGGGLFEDRTQAFGLGASSMEATGFGTAWFDFDNDGWLDLFVANGTVMAVEALLRAKDPFPLRQPNQLFRNRKGKVFVDVSTKAGASFRLSEVSRGAAFGDVDNDGDTDILVANNNGPTRLLINQVGQKHRWLGIRLDTDTKQGTRGAQVGVAAADGTVRWRRVRVDGSYASAHDHRLLFGMGSAAKVTQVQVHWPDGSHESWENVGLDTYIVLKKGSGRKLP